MASSLLCIANSKVASSGLSRTICAKPFSSEISPMSAACASTLVVLNDANSRTSVTAI